MMIGETLFILVGFDTDYTYFWPHHLTYLGCSYENKPYWFFIIESKVGLNSIQ